MKFLCEVDHRRLTAVHYKENGKYWVWYFITGQPYKTYGIFQIRGISEPLTKDDLIKHIDKIWEEHNKNKEHEQGMI